MEKAIKLIINLVWLIQQMERDGVYMSPDEIKIVWEAKTFLGYSNPTSIEKGTGVKVGRLK